MPSSKGGNNGSIKQYIKGIVNEGSKAKTKDESWVQFVTKDKDKPKPPDNTPSPQTKIKEISKEEIKRDR